MRKCYQMKTRSLCNCVFYQWIYVGNCSLKNEETNEFLVVSIRKVFDFVLNLVVEFSGRLHILVIFG